LFSIRCRVGHTAFVLENLGEISAVDPSAAGWTPDEMHAVADSHTETE